MLLFADSGHMAVDGAEELPQDSVSQLEARLQRVSVHVRAHHSEYDP